MRARGLGFVVVVLLAASVLAGCGSSSGDNLSVSAFRTQMNGLCRSERAALVAEGKRAERQHLDFAEVTPPIERIQARFLARIRHINPPTALFGRQDQLVADLVRMSGVVSRPFTVSSAQIRHLVKTRDARVIADMRQLGLSGCVATLEQPSPQIDA